jgi:outer membrane autotransporter protein
VNLYAGWNKGALNIIGGVGYAFGDHDVEMALPASLGKLDANVDTSAITADLRAEYQLKTAWVDVLPHAGVRYTALHTESQNHKLGGATVSSLESETQHIVQFPVGVTLSKDFDLSGWNVKPMVDVSVIPAAGDKDSEGKVRFSGLNASDSFTARVMDSCSWAGTVGVQAEKGNMSFGLNYGVQTSSHETDQNIQVKFGWKF